MYEETATILANIYEDASGNADGVKEDASFVALLPGVQDNIEGLYTLTGLQAAFGAGNISNPPTEAEIQAVIDAGSAVTPLTGNIAAMTFDCGYQGASLTTQYAVEGSPSSGTKGLLVMTFTTGADVTTPQVLFETAKTSGSAVYLNAGELQFYLGRNENMDMNITGILANTTYTLLVHMDTDSDFAQAFLSQGTVDPFTLSADTADSFAGVSNWTDTDISGSGDMGVCNADAGGSVPGDVTSNAFLGTSTGLVAYRTEENILASIYEDASGNADGYTVPFQQYNALPSVSGALEGVSCLGALSTAFAAGDLTDPITEAQLQAAIDRANGNSLIGHVNIETYACGFASEDAVTGLNLDHALEGYGEGTYGAFSQTFTTGADVTTPQLLFETGGIGRGTAVNVNAGTLELYAGNGNNIDLSISGIAANTSYTYLVVADVENDYLYLMLSQGTVDPTTMGPTTADDFVSNTNWTDSGIDGGDEMGVCQTGASSTLQGGTTDAFLGTGGDVLVYKRSARIYEDIYEDASGNADGILTPVSHYTTIGVTGMVDTNIMTLAYNEGFQNALADGALNNPATVAELQAVVDAVNAEDDLILAGLVADETIAASTTDYTSLTGRTGYADQRLVLTHSFTTDADVTTPQLVFKTGGSGTGIGVIVNNGNLEFYVGDDDALDLSFAVTGSTDYAYIMIYDVIQNYLEVYLQSGTLDPTIMRPSTATAVERNDNYIETNTISGTGDLAIGAIGDAGEIAFGVAAVQGEVTADPFLGTVGDVTVYFSTSNEIVPVITVTAGTDTLEVDTAATGSFTDAGATANDDIDGDVTLNIITEGVADVDLTVVGTYTITYSVYDSAGNKAVRTREVIIQDTTKPVIALTGDAAVTHEVNTSYTDAGTTVTDNYDTGLTTTAVGTVDTTALGTYTLTYDVSDASGNAADQVERVVEVVDSTKPVITVSSDNPATHEAGTTYTDAGATVSDNFDTGLTTTAVGTVDTSALGTYTLTYDVSDSSSNAADQASRVVEVVDTTAPVIALTGDNPLTLEAGAELCQTQEVR